jgi:hypothetical protein
MSKPLSRRSRDYFGAISHIPASGRRVFGVTRFGVPVEGRCARHTLQDICVDAGFVQVETDYAEAGGVPLSSRRGRYEGRCLRLNLSLCPLPILCDPLRPLRLKREIVRLRQSAKSKDHPTLSVASVTSVALENGHLRTTIYG